MSITHHIPEELLAAFAAGRLDEGQALAVATHLEHCDSCRATVHALEEIGGRALEEIEPAGMHAGALAAVLAQLDHAPPTPPAPRAEAAAERWLPASVRPYALSGWKWVAPGVSMRPILLPASSSTRAFFLRSAKGTSLLQHTHSGTEMTCVLSGSFSHAGGTFAAGDFDYGDDSVEHQPLVGSDEDCVCLVAMTGELRLKGLLGRIMQPFIRL